MTAPNSAAPDHPAPDSAQPNLTPARTKALKGEAHHLSPVVMIGAAGLTDAVLAEISTALDAHELIKVRVAGDSRDERRAIMAKICEQLACAPVQSIGKQLVLYREKPAKSKEADVHVPKQLAAQGKKPGSTQRPSRKSNRASNHAGARTNTSGGKARAKPRKLSRNEKATGGRGGTNKRGRKKAGPR